MENGQVVRTMSSQEGVRQWDVLGAGLFALSMRNIYDRSVAGSALAVAVMDDLLCWEF